MGTRNYLILYKTIYMYIYVIHRLKADLRFALVECMGTRNYLILYKTIYKHVQHARLVVGKRDAWGSVYQRKGFMIQTCSLLNADAKGLKLWQ